MDFIKRKVFLTKYLRPFDTNGDGIFNAIVLSATTKTIQIPLRHSFDDMGIFETYDEELFEIIDVGSLFDGSITGITQPSSGTTSPNIDWNTGGGSSSGFTTNGDKIEYCGDLTATNGVTLSYNGTTATLTPNGGNPTTFNAPTPDFVINNSLCIYEGVTGAGDGNNPIQPNVSGRQCISSCGNCGVKVPASPLNNLGVDRCNPELTIFNGVNGLNTWPGYTITALIKALQHCQSLGYDRLLDNNDFIGTAGPMFPIPQGNATNTQPFAGVSLYQEYHVTPIPTNPYNVYPSPSQCPICAQSAQISPVNFPAWGVVAGVSLLYGPPISLDRYDFCFYCAKAR